MWVLLLGLVLFVAPHLLREFGLRDTVVQAMPSPGAYKGLYSLVALAGLVLIIVGKSRSDFIMIWQPIFELRYISHVLMIPAVMLVLAGNLPLGHIRKQLRNPMLLGVCLWGLAHLWSNGDLASMLLFGTFAVWAGSKAIFRGLTLPPPAGSPKIMWDIIAMLTGLMLYVLISLYHGQLFGVGLLSV